MFIPLEYGKFYHIYNRGDNYRNLFFTTQDYLHFLGKYDIYISSVADTYAWCLMKNHFHLLVRIKNEHEIGFLNSEHAYFDNPNLKWKVYFPEQHDKRFKKKPIPSTHFEHLFNAYARWFNIWHECNGTLFEKNYQRKLADNMQYFSNLIVYIHNNPVKHGFVQHSIEYPWTSYKSIKSDKPTKLKRNEVMGCFNTIENFDKSHQIAHEDNENIIRDWIIE